jgi:cytochrome c2
MTPRWTASIAGLALAASTALVVACGSSTKPSVLPGADAQRGHDLIQQIGCGSCHRIGGVSGADGAVGPALRDFKSNRYIAGHLPATPENVARWIRNPQAIEPQTIMPNLGVDERDARDIVAYLESQ